MAREIEIPKCVNYTDLREKKDVPAIEAEAIVNYAKSLNPEEVKIFLKEVPDDVLISVLHTRLMERQCKIDSIARYLGI